jgi:hypothetical protein
MLSGCGSTATNGMPQTPQGPGTPSDPGSTATANSTAAFVYVSNQPGSGSGPLQIVAYSADANGQLSPVAGSPFNEDVDSIAVNGPYLMASSTSAPDINTYTVGSDGALTLATQFDYSKQTGYQAGECGGVGNVYFDHGGQSLYAGVFNYSCTDNEAIASFGVDSASGSLNYLGIENIGYESNNLASFTADDAFAYSAHDDNCMYGGISSFTRASSGLLTELTSGTVTPPQGPPAPPGATSAGVKLASYAAALATTDSSNHVAMAEAPCFEQDGVVATQIQLATWTVDASGNLSTADTSATMPGTKVTNPFVMKISPSGTLLAVGGVGGLQVFHFNGASPITAYSDLLTTDPIQHIAWDNENHLYATTVGASSGVSAGKLYVFTVPDTTGSGQPQQAAGSPYSIAAPRDLAVEAK